MNTITYLNTVWTQTQDLLEKLLINGGPQPEQYEQLNEHLYATHTEISDGRLPAGEVRAYFKSLAERVGPSTCQGYSFLKPRGYAGDFAIIDRIYRRQCSENPALVRWDRFAHSHPAMEAVRNRKEYFLRLIEKSLSWAAPGLFQVLNLGSGPGRDVAEALSQNPTAGLNIQCVDQDPAAIDYASELCRAYLDRAVFTLANVLRFKPAIPVDLIWSAGLFDYLNDRTFCLLLRRLLPFVKPGGQLVVGNFSPTNESRPFMELAGDWKLNYRSSEHLRTLAARAGIPADCVHVGQEPAGVNLFLHIRLPRYLPSAQWPISSRKSAFSDEMATCN